MAIAVLNLSKKTVLFIIEKLRTVITSMTGNANYTTPVPTLVAFAALIDDLETKYQDAINGGKDKKALVRIAQAALLESSRTLTGYVQSASGGDEVKILSAGFDVKRPRTPVGILPPPANVRSKFGNVAGEIIVFWAGVPKKLVYKVQRNDTPGDETAWKDYLYTGKSRIVVSDLTTDKMYAFRIASLSASGLGDWSDQTIHKAL